MPSLSHSSSVDPETVKPIAPTSPTFRLSVQVCSTSSGPDSGWGVRGYGIRFQSTGVLTRKRPDIDVVERAVNWGSQLLTRLRVILTLLLNYERQGVNVAEIGPQLSLGDHRVFWVSVVPGNGGVCVKHTLSSGLVWKCKVEVCEHMIGGLLLASEGLEVGVSQSWVDCYSLNVARDSV